MTKQKHKINIKDGYGYIYVEDSPDARRIRDREERWQEWRNKCEQNSNGALPQPTNTELSKCMSDWLALISANATPCPPTPPRASSKPEGHLFTEQ